MLDQILMPEMKRIYEEMRLEERECSAEEKKERHQIFRDFAREIIEISYLTRKNGLLYLEEYLEELQEPFSENRILKDMIRLIVDGRDPEEIGQIILMKYFSEDRDLNKSLLDIMCIYGILSVQAGVNPRYILKLMNNMIPDDVEIEEDLFDWAGGKKENKKEVDIEKICQGEIRLEPKDPGFLEIKICDELLKSSDGRMIQRVLREFYRYTIITVLEGLSGEGRKKVLSNVTKANAMDYAGEIEIREDDYYRADGRRFLWARRVKDAAINFLDVIDKLERAGEIVFSRTPEIEFLSLIMDQIRNDKEVMKDQKDRWDMLIRMLEGYKSNTFEMW